MFKAKVIFGNGVTRERTFDNKGAANDYASDLFNMFQAEEKWFDKEELTFMVTVPHIEIVDA